MKCRLLPHKKRKVVSIQEMKQIIGWQISAFNLPEKWKYTQGEGVKIGVLDTGCDYNHPDLADNLLEGYNVLEPGKPPIDFNDHGTFVGSSICAKNNEFGIVGVAPLAKIVPIKVLDENGLGEIENVAKGIKWAVDKVDMMCLSLGSPKPLSVLRKAVKLAYSNNIPLFCAGGNVNKNFDVLFPAAYPETIAIGCCDKNWKRADFSNTAKKNIDFLAPGVDILACVRNGGYAVMSGSSMSTPFVVAAAALMLSAKRKYNLNFKLETVEDYREIFKLHGIDELKYSGDKIFAGYGIVSPTTLIEWMEKKQL